MQAERASSTFGALLLLLASRAARGLRCSCCREGELQENVLLGLPGMLQGSGAVHFQLQRKVCYLGSSSAALCTLG